MRENRLDQTHFSLSTAEYRPLREYLTECRHIWHKLMKNAVFDKCRSFIKVATCDFRLKEPKQWDARKITAYGFIWRTESAKIK